MQVLVTGGAGCTGAGLGRHLVGTGLASASVVNELPSSSKDNLAETG